MFGTDTLLLSLAAVRLSSEKLLTYCGWVAIGDPIKFKFVGLPVSLLFDVCIGSITLAVVLAVVTTTTFGRFFLSFFFLTIGKASNDDGCVAVVVSNVDLSSIVFSLDLRRIPLDFVIVVGFLVANEVDFIVLGCFVDR